MGVLDIYGFEIFEVSVLWSVDSNVGRLVRLMSDTFACLVFPFSQSPSEMALPDLIYIGGLGRFILFKFEFLK